MTMRTMVKDPYVWHVPVLTGASGGEEVRRFYSTRFIGHTPADAVLRRISRTVSAARVIDEFVLEFRAVEVGGNPGGVMVGRCRPRSSS